MRSYYRFFQCVAQFLGIVFWRVRVFGREHVPPTGPVILAGNHQSYMDPVLLGLSLHRECGYMGREGAFKYSLTGRFLKSLNGYAIKRGSADVRAIKETLRRLRDGQMVAAFPEGTRTPDGRIHPLQGGLALLAKRSGAVLVPAVVHGAYEAWPRHRSYPVFGRVYVEFGIGFTPAEYADWSPEELTTRLQHRMRSMHNRLRIRYNQAPFEYGCESGAAESWDDTPNDARADAVRSTNGGRGRLSLLA